MLKAQALPQEKLPRRELLKEEFLQEQQPLSSDKGRLVQLGPAELREVVRDFQQALADAQEASAHRTHERSRSDGRRGAIARRSSRGDEGLQVNKQYLVNVGKRSSERMEGSHRSAGPTYEMLAHDALCVVFRSFAAHEEGDVGADTKHSSSMNSNEVLVLLSRPSGRAAPTKLTPQLNAPAWNGWQFLSFCEIFGLMPRVISKKDALQLFREINKADGVSDYDANEFSQLEFLRAIEVISKRMGLANLTELVLEPQEELNHHSSSPDGGGAPPPQVRSLGDLSVRDMQLLLKMSPPRPAAPHPATPLPRRPAAPLHIRKRKPLPLSAAGSELIQQMQGQSLS